MRFLARAILWFEPALLAVVVVAFWFISPERVYFLALLIPPMLARLILYRRLWANVSVNIPLYLFLLLCVINTAVALQNPTMPPYSWGWYVVGRPVMGVALALSIASIVYETGRLKAVLLAALLLAVLVGVLGLTASLYDPSKSYQLWFLIQHLPQLRSFPGAEGGFNVNEVGGAMAFFLPLTAGVVMYDLRAPRRAWLRLSIATAAMVMLALSLILGQSRLALIGVVVALAALVLLLIQKRRWRLISLALLGVFCLIEIGIVIGVFYPMTVTPELNARDESSLEQRPVIWNAAIDIIRDYPLTGVGLNEFRSRQVRAVYPVPDFSMPVVPHAHDELLEIGTDAGIPGMILFIAWHVVLAVIAWRAWRDGDPLVRMVAASAAAGLVAHSIFGLADAITLFDRFTWAYWLLVGLVCGAYAFTRRAGTLHAGAGTSGNEETMNT